MPYWKVTEPFIGLRIYDEPLGYQPSRGPRVSFLMLFDQRDNWMGTDTGIFGVGPRWSFPWLAFVVDDDAQRGTVHLGNGTERQMLSDGTTSDPLLNAKLERLTSGATTTGFKLHYASGAIDVFSKQLTQFWVDNKDVYFLSSRLDPAGSQMSFTYNNDPDYVRLLRVNDADGRTNTLSYGGSYGGYTNLITGITDPFGRSISLAYDSSGRLTNITDVAGLSSGFSYGTNNWVTSLVTPYGTNQFRLVDAMGGDLVDGRSVEVTDPMGLKHLYAFLDNASDRLSNTCPAGDTPSTTNSGVFSFSNTFCTTNLASHCSYYWSPLQYAKLSTNYLAAGDIAQLTAGDLTVARSRCWLLTSDRDVSSSLSVERDPSPDGSTLGHRTWYDYASKPALDQEGNQSLPLFVAHVMDDQSGFKTHFVRTARNGYGKVTETVESYTRSDGVVAVRTNSLTYSTDGIDLVKMVDPSGTQVSSNLFNTAHQVATNFNALNELTVYQYDATTHNLTSLLRPSGLTSVYAYYASNDSDYHRRGYLQSVVDTGYRTNSFGYTNGLVWVQTNELGLVIRNTYDALQRLRRVDYPDSTFITNTYDKLDLVRTLDRLGFTNDYAFDRSRRLILHTNALRTVTAYGYCDCGSLDYVTNALGTGLQQVTHFVYDDAGRRTESYYPDGYALTNRYSLGGRLTNRMDSLSSLTNSYNLQGLLVLAVNPQGTAIQTKFDLEDHATNTVDASGVTTTNTWDALDRLASRTVVGAGTEQFVYTARGLTNYTDQLGRTTLYVHDSLGRKTAETNANSEVIQYSYDPAGNLLTLSDGRSLTTRWNYDSYGRVTNKVDALNQEILRYGYDANGRLTNRWSAAKGTTGYSYDPAGNMTAVNYPSSQDLGFTYDPLGRMTNMTDAVGTTAFTYNAANQVATEDGPWDADTVTYGYTARLPAGVWVSQPDGLTWALAYGYDSARRLTNVTSGAGSFGYGYGSASPLVVTLGLPGGAVITNRFDSAGRWTDTQLKTSAGSVLNSHSYVYTNNNQRIRQTFMAGNTMDYTYDRIGQLTSAIGRESGGSTRLQEQFGFGYDASWNLRNRTNNALVQTFNVDNVNELTTATRSGTLTVAGTTYGPATSVTVNRQTATRYGDNTFAKSGFSLSNGTNTFSASATDSLGRSASHGVSVYLPATATFQYDGNGNLVSDGRRSLEYDDENQLVAVTVTNTWRSEFAYDGRMRRRVRREYGWAGGNWVLAAEVRYVYQGNLVVEERDGNNRPRVAYTRGRDLGGSLESAGGIGGLLGRTDLSGFTPGHAYYHADGNGNITALVNGQQAVVARYAYDPYGNVLAQGGPLAEANLYRFSSKETHVPSGLVYYLYRFYDPNLQRWLNRDPIGEEGDLNLYRFLRNEPPTYIDSDGEIGLPAILAAVAVGHCGRSAIFARLAWDCSKQHTQVAGRARASLEPERYECWRRANRGQECSELISAALREAAYCASWGMGRLVLIRSGVHPLKAIGLQ